MRKLNWKKIAAVGFCAVLAGATLAGCSPRITQEQVDAAVEQAKVEQQNADLVAQQTAMNEAYASGTAAGADAATAEANTVISDRDAKIAELQAQLALESEQEVAAATEENGYILDDLEIGAEFEKTISDREISIFDGKVEFKDDDYDAEEVVYLKGKIASNEEDFAGKTYVQFNEEQLSYEVRFDNDLDTGDIDEDDTLKFSLLGEDVEVSDWDGDTVTFTKGVSFLVKEGQELTVDDKTLKIETISGTKILVSCGDAVEVIREGETEDVDGIQVRAVEVLDDDDGNDLATIEVGKDVLFQVSDGDEYSKDSIYSWKITNSTIGVELNTDLTDLDEDEAPLGLGDKLCLPENYVCVRYDGLTAEDTVVLDMEKDTKSGNEYVEVKGSFINGLDDYDKVWVRDNKIYDEDLALIGSSIEIDNTDLVLAASSGKLVIDDIKIDWDLDMVKVNGVDISGFDEDYLTSYGILINNPDDSVEDESFKITIPEEELKAQITVLPKQ